MDVTLTIRGSLADALQRLATERGVSVEALGQELLAAGLATTAGIAGEGEVAILGSIMLPASTLHQPLRLRSPIIARGPVPTYTIEMLPRPATDTNDAD